MSQALASQAFLERLDAVRFRRLLVNLTRLAIRSFLLAVLGVVLLAAADYACELSRSVRQMALVGLLLAIAIQLVFSLQPLFLRSRRSRLAVEIERAFPVLGQSLRTAVEFGHRSRESVAADGASSSFVAALEEQVDRATNALPLGTLIPTRRLQVALAVAVVALGLAGVLAACDWQWRTALGHALLAESPYTRMEVTPGTLRLDYGEELSIGIQVMGRTNRQLTLFTRPLAESEADWQEREITAADRQSSTSDRAGYAVTLPRIDEPLAYYVAASELTSEQHQITLRYPLQLQKIQVELTPPSYTGLEPATLADGNVRAIEGTAAVFRFHFDRAPVSAKVLLSEPRGRATREDQSQPQEAPVQIDGATLTFPLELLASKNYTLSAEAADGAKLPETTYSIRVQRDYPPQLAFEQPSEVLEVHGLAEVLLRVRLQDDFGLTKAGIVFRVNNEEEHTLFQHDFAAAPEIDSQSDDSKRQSPVTAAVLAKHLPLEHFELTQKDSVTYYAFVEDNHPSGPRRTETDLRFIDIRPFKRNFQRPDPGASGGGNVRPDGLGSDGKPLAALSELIARQRTALNRTRQVARRSADQSASLDLAVVEKLVEFQQQLTVSTHDVAEALLFYQIPGNDIYFKAEDSMRSAVDSLSAGNYDTAFLQEQDALRFLIEGRESVTTFLSSQPQRTQEELAAALRLQLQELRNRRSNADAPEIANRLRYLSRQEKMLTRALETSGEAMPGSNAVADVSDPEKDTDTNPSSDSEKDDPAPPSTDEEMHDNEPREPDRPDPKRMQADIVMEAADIQNAMEKIADLSPLARARIAEAQETAEDAAEALERGNSRQAALAAEKAADIFRELARHIEGLTSNDGSEKIALAQHIAAEIARLEREFAEALSRSASDAEQTEMRDEEQAAQLRAQSERLAQAGKTLDDVLNQMLQSTEPSDREIARRVQELSEEQQLPDAVRQLESQAQESRSKQPSRAEVEAKELADRFEAAALQLELLHRSIVAPRMADLMELERAAGELQEKLDRLETERQITDWHREAERLLDELKERGLAEESRKILAEMLKENRTDGPWNWAQADDRFTPPGGYGVAVSKLAADLRAAIQELVLGKLPGEGDERTPPQYDRLIERYYQVLSSER